LLLASFFISDTLPACFGGGSVSKNRVIEAAYAGGRGLLYLNSLGYSLNEISKQP
jgi:hypothetical protein